MRTYDNYTPEIDYSEEGLPLSGQTPQIPGSGPEKTRKKKTKISAKQTRSQRKQADAPVKKEIKKSGVSFYARCIRFFTSASFRILCGLFVGCLCVYFAVAFCSYFTTCIEDQSKLLSSPVGAAAGVANPAGEGGARLAEIVINEGFGVGALVIVIWLGAISLKLLMGRPRFRTLDFTIKCFVALLTLSLIVGLLTYSLHTSVNWGGYHGTYVNEFIIQFIGSVGAVLLSIFMVALFVVICMRDLVYWIIRKKRARDERRRLEEEQKAIILAKEEEMRRMKAEEEIEDLKAGESLSFPGNETDPDENDPDGLSFSQGDEPLYSLSETEKNSTSASVIDYNLNSTSQGLQNEYSSNLDSQSDQQSNQDLCQDSYSDREESINGEPSGIATNGKASENEADSSTSVSTSEKEEAKDSKMVVNVNEIGQSTNKRFTPDIEVFENQKYKFPPYEILRPGKERISIDTEEQVENKRKIEKTLLDFGIKITQIEATVGPTVTLYEIVPAAGVKISNIRNLVDDIALSLSAKGVRIIAPIPGKGTVGIEVANRDPQMVSMRTVIQSKKYQNSNYHLPIALGSTISNEVYIADLAKMPHLLVAGATGQGKSVGLNAIIASILYCKAPHEVKFVMIDPKQVEFSLYNKLKNYYMAMVPSNADEEPVITDSSRVESTLSSLVIEMEQRYTLLKNAQTRNIEEYNGKIRDGKLNPGDGHKFLPYIVVVVDEFGDLVMELKKNVELPIARLAQKARAVGMHVIIATQRPSTDVITGIIKANFPARISFKVASGVDSKTILDTPGAQQLIGRGDMLIFNNSEMVRVQCAFIDTPEVEEICEYVSRQPYPQGIYELPEPMVDGKSGADANILNDKDPLFSEVARAVVSSGRASTSNVQRNYEIGYNRAGRIMDQLEAAGIVGPSLGGKPRVVLVDPNKLEEILAKLGY